MSVCDSAALTSASHIAADTGQSPPHDETSQKACHINNKSPHNFVSFPLDGFSRAYSCHKPRRQDQDKIHDTYNSGIKQGNTFP